MKTQDEVIELPVEKGILLSVPSEEQGPIWCEYGQGTKWCATLVERKDSVGQGIDLEDFRSRREPDTDRIWWKKAERQKGYYIPKGVARGVVIQFGTNRVEDRRRRGRNYVRLPSIDDLDEDDFSQSSPPQEIRSQRWNGVIVSVELNEERTGFLRLRKCGSVRRAMKVAVGISGADLEGKALQAFLNASRGGDFGAMGMMIDWLIEQGDSRGSLFRGEVMGFLTEFFPEVREQGERS